MDVEVEDDVFSVSKGLGHLVSDVPRFIIDFSVDVSPHLDGVSAQAGFDVFRESADHSRV